MAEPKKPKSLPIVQVDWIDACNPLVSWEEREKIAEEGPATVHTWGVVVRNDATAITVASDYDPKHDTCNGVTVIPRGMVKKIHRLGTWRAR